MLEIDCRKCINCNIVNGCCRIYGSDPNKAVKACAAYGFENYILVGDKRVKKSLLHGTQAWRNILIDYDKMIQAPDITLEALNRVFRYVCALESRLKRVLSGLKRKEMRRWRILRITPMQVRFANTITIVILKMVARCIRQIAELMNGAAFVRKTRRRKTFIEICLWLDCWVHLDCITFLFQR